MDRTNESDLEWVETDRDGVRFRRKQLGHAAAGERIGCSLYELPPSGRSWPYHYHTANEEAIYVLSGTGILETEDGEHDLRAGEYVSLPIGAEGGHRVINDSADRLRYLVISTMREPDVTVYPQADAIGVFAGSPPGGREERIIGEYFKLCDARGYWDAQS